MKIKTNTNFEDSRAEVPFDAVIVPGLPYGDSTWSNFMEDRISWAKYLIDEKFTKHIIFSGSAVHSPYVESEIMKQYAIKIGIPPEIIFTETSAEHSTENVYYSMQLARSKGFDKIALATDPFQSYMLTLYIEYHSFDINYLPIQYSILKAVNLRNIKIEPARALVPDFVPLREREHYFDRLQGTLGNHIEYEQ